jgi:hypothetical protein
MSENKVCGPTHALTYFNFPFVKRPVYQSTASYSGSNP